MTSYFFIVTFVFAVLVVHGFDNLGTRAIHSPSQLNADRAIPLCGIREAGETPALPRNC